MPDALSRRPDFTPIEKDNTDITLLPSSLFVKRLDSSLQASLQLPDPLSDPIISLATDALSGKISPPARSSIQDWKYSDGILYFKNRAYVPPSARHHVLTLCHDHLTAGHPGHFRTEELVKRDYWWPSLSSYVRDYVSGCALCQQMKPNTHPSDPALSPIPSKALRPFEQLSVDLITDLPLSDGFDSIMVMVDHGLSKGVILSPCNKTITAEGIADSFLSESLLPFWSPFQTHLRSWPPIRFKVCKRTWKTPSL